VSARVLSCPLLSHSYCPHRSCRKNPCYNRRMSEKCSFVPKTVADEVTSLISRRDFAPATNRSPRTRPEPASCILGFLIGSASKSVQNPYKSDHFRKCEFFTPVIPTTYNFNALKCTDFQVGTSLRRRPCGFLITPGRSAKPEIPEFRFRFPKIVKIGELADFQPIRPRCTNDLRKSKSAIRRFSADDPFPENRNFPD